jgi:hypothetical protein
MKTTEDTLEPIHPIEETPYGALVVHNDVLCTPTSLCTWSNAKPAVYCQLPPHTISPVCQEVNKGIGLMGCYDEPTCGGLLPASRTKRLLEEKPHYVAIIRNQEKKLQNQEKSSNILATLVLSLILGILSFLVVLLLARQTYKTYKKRKSMRKTHINQTRKHSASHRISTGAGKTGKPVNK